jgi:hypothetical protein
MEKLKNISLIIFILLISQDIMAQKGHYVSAFGLYQYTGINNREDYFERMGLLELENTYHFSYGIQYIRNYTDIFGIEAGIKYAITGQKYSGHITYDPNIGQDVDLDYESEVIMDFIQVPVLLRFNSKLDDDVISLSIAAGFQADFLKSVDAKTNPAPIIPAGGELDYKSLFSNFNLSFASHASFTIKLSDNWFTFIGFHMSRSISDIEKKNFNYDKTIHPVEYYFPVSTKKEDYPVFNPSTGLSRPSTKITNYGLLLGISYLIKS